MSNGDEYGVDKGDPDPFTGAIVALVIVLLFVVIFF
jgi:hypothetical protein